MEKLRRPDGVEIAWGSAGEGPLVVLANQYFSKRDVFRRLLEDLAADHTVVWYDVRGTGESTRTGPYDLGTDADDLGALIEHLGPPAVVIGMADGCNRAVHLAAARSELVSAIVSPGGNPVGRRAAEGTDALVASSTVLGALVGMMQTDYRGALNTIFATSNPDLSDAEVRERVTTTVEYCDQDVGVERFRLWVHDDSIEPALALGDRLWILQHGTNPWFTIEIARRTAELLPDCNVMEVENGPVSRPDITAGVVRRITSTVFAGASEARQARN